MPTKNNVVLTQECHSPKSLWGIFRILSCCTDSIKVVILNLIQDLPRLLFLLRKGVRGRFQIKFGMTPLFNKNAFTLIELLVVVLIIAILAAIALPQYQKAVVKSQFASLKAINKAINDAEEFYYLTHGTYTDQLDLLDIQLPPALSNSTGKLGPGYKEKNWAWGSCGVSLTSNEGGARSVCYHSKIKMSIGQYFKHAQPAAVVLWTKGKRRCTAADTNRTSITQRICQQESGLSAPSNPYDGRDYIY